MSEDIKTTHACPVCKLEYENKEWAEKCEAWCREHHTCNIDIIKHAMSPKDDSATNKQ